MHAQTSGADHACSTGICSNVDVIVHNAGQQQQQQDREDGGVMGGGGGMAGGAVGGGPRQRRAVALSAAWCSLAC